MEPEKVIVQPPPPYKGENTIKQKHMLVAVGVACVCATALFVVCVGGGIWINHLKDQTMQGNSDTEGGTDSTEKKSESGFEKTINININIDDEEKSVSDKVQLDKIKNEEVDLQYNEEGHLEYVSVMDYDTNIYGSYSVPDNECFIYHAGDHKYNSVEELLDNVFDKDNEEAHYNSTRMDFEIDQKPVTDHSILPNNLQPYCKGKNVYWIRPMEPTCEKEEDHGRQKRATYYCLGGYWSYRGRCCGCRCPRVYRCGCFNYWVCVGGRIIRG